MKKILTLMLVLTMALAALAGCDTTGKQTDATSSPPQTTKASGATPAPTEDPLGYLNLDTTMPIVKEGSSLTLKLISVQQDWATASPEDHYIWAFFKEYCNLDLDVTYYQGGSWAEQRNLVFTGGDLPDIFYQCGFSTSDMVRYGQGEGLLHPLEDLIEQYAPLIKMAIEANPNILLETKTPDGHMYCIPRITAEYVELNTVRMFINKAWLDQGGLKMPSTLDDLTEVLRYFRDGDPNGNGEADEIPWLGTAGGTGTVVLTALGMNTNSSLEIFVKSDGKTVSSPPLEDNYIHYLTYMKQLMDEGLFNSDFYTMSTEQVNATLARNIVGLSQMAAPFINMPEPEQYRQYESLIPLTSAYNSERVWPVGTSLGQGTFAIAYDTEYPEAAIRMANVFFEEGIPLLFWLGPIKSESYEPQYPIEGWDPSFCYYEDGAFGIECPDGTDAWTYINNHVGIYNGGPVGFMYKDQQLYDQLGMHDARMPENELIWRESMQANVAPYEKQPLPTLFLDVETLERANELITPINDYIETMEAKFIMGNEPLENIDAFKEQLKSLGIEEFLQIYQDAYDAYLANVAG